MWTIIGKRTSKMIFEVLNHPLFGDEISRGFDGSSQQG
jgi:hypothetical protein